MTTIKVPYHKEYREFCIPDSDKVEIVKPNYDKYDQKKDVSEEEIISTALANPIDKPRLSEMVDSDSKVAIIVDDNTRPTPTSRILPHILNILEDAGTRDANVTIIFARGTHRELSEKEEKELLGKRVWKKYRVIQHDSSNEDQLIQLPNSNKKANKWAVEADLRILTGFIKSHDIAGYSGGAKSILPGIADFDTILSNHSYTNLSDSSTGIGIIEGNPCREEMEDMARELEPNFIINVVLNRDDAVIRAAAGDVISAHREGVKLYNEIAMVKVESPGDMVMACCPYPTDSNLYQAMYGGAVAVKVSKPILKRDGVIMLVAHCPEGLGDESFSELIMKHRQPDKILKTLSEQDSTKLGQWGVQLWADMLNYASIILVSEGGIPEEYFEKTPMKHTSSLEEAWKIGKELIGKKNVDGYVLPRAPLTLPLVD